MTLRSGVDLVLNRILPKEEPNQFEVLPKPIPAPKKLTLMRRTAEAPPTSRKLILRRRVTGEEKPQTIAPPITPPLQGFEEDEEALRQEAIKRGESHYWYEPEKAWKLVEKKEEVPLSRMPFTKKQPIWRPESSFDKFFNKLVRASEVSQSVLWPLAILAGIKQGKFPTRGPMITEFGAMGGSVPQAQRQILKRMAEINKLLGTKGKLPEGIGTRASLQKELSILEDAIAQTIPKTEVVIPKKVTPVVPKKIPPAIPEKVIPPLFTEAALSPEAVAKIQSQAEEITAIKTKLVDWVKQAKSQRRVIEKAKHEARVPKIGEFGERLGKAETVEEVRGAIGAMKGRILPTVGMELEKPLIERLSPEEAKTFIQHIISHPVFERKPLAARNTILALAKKEAPTLGELRNLRKVLGADFVKAYEELGRTRGWARVAQLFTEIINIPKALFASLDFMPLFRQAIFMVPRYPIKAFKAFWTGTQPYFRSAKWVEEVDDAIRNSEFAPLRQKLDLTELPARERVLTKVEEAYGTSILYRIPVIKQTVGVLIKRSERVFVTTLNKFRADIFDGYARVWRDKATQDVYDELAEFINISTGRGAITQSEKLKAVVAHLNTVLFSPRLNISRVQTLGLPLVLWKYSPTVRKVALGNIGAFLSAVGGIVGLVKLLNHPDLTVEENSNSTDYGMIKYKDTRIDPYGGHAAYIRFASRLITGKMKTSAGEIVDIDRFNETIKFLRMKLSPFASFITDLLAGETAIGEELTTKEKDVKKQIFNRITSGAIQDFIEAIRMYGMPEGMIGLLSFASIGVNTYPSRTYMDWLNKMEEVRDKEWTMEEIIALRPDFNASEKGWFDYLQLDKGKSRRFYREGNPEIDASLYFWGEVNELLSNDALEEFRKLAQRYNVPEDIYPLRVNVEIFEVKGKDREEIFDELLNDAPAYLSEYLYQNRVEWMMGPIAEKYQTFADMRTRDDLLLSSYQQNNMGKTTKEKERYRREHPDVDAALNFWGKATTVQSREAKLLLQKRASEIGIPTELIPALIPKKTTKKRKITLK